jgi:Transposase DDE domain
MLLGDVFETFVNDSPVSVMVRGTLEHALPAAFVDELFERHAKVQYKRELLFSSVVDLMAAVVCKIHPAVNAAYQRRAHEMPVGRRAVYDKINGVETQVSRALVRETSRRLIPVIEALGGTLPDILPGYPVRILDGSHLAASEHRIGELRTIAAGPLPGQSLVVLDPRCMLPVDVFPCEDGHAQERSILLNLPDILVPGEVWIADRNFCVAWFLFEIANNHAFFVIRQHAANVRWEPVGRRHKIGRTSTGMVYEQTVRIHDDFKNSLEVRRITIVLDEPTEDGDTEIHLLTNLPRKVKAVRIADAYRHRWTIEGAFAELAKTLNSEISSLGYPSAD